MYISGSKNYIILLCFYSSSNVNCECHNKNSNHVSSMCKLNGLEPKYFSTLLPLKRIVSSSKFLFIKLIVYILDAHGHMVFASIYIYFYMCWVSLLIISKLV